MYPWWMFVLIGVVSYLLGSISSGLLLARFSGGPNLRQVGSGNTGATNVLRTMGWQSGMAVFVCDFLKNLLACVLGWLLCGRYGAMLAGLCAIIGHNWPCFFQFRGGKGVASSAAAIAMAFPVPGLISWFACVGAIILTRYVSVGSMTLTTLFAALMCAHFAHGDPLAILWALAIAGLCLYRHRENILRLIHGTERRFGEEKTPQSPPENG